MTDRFSLLTLFAEGEGPGFQALLMPMVAIGFLWYFLLIRPQRREQAKRDTLLKALKKNDRVVTIGGIIGSIANVSQDGKEVTLKVDDNTRIKIIRSSIQSVLKEESAEVSSK
jgi:preprotein translocase subunit YajC